jgi:hypothetical protein
MTSCKHRSSKQNDETKQKMTIAKPAEEEEEKTGTPT